MTNSGGVYIAILSPDVRGSVELVLAMAGALGSSTPNPMAHGSGHV